MTINERIRYLRKEVLKLNQTDFANAIGMKQTGLSYIEKNNSTVKEQVAKSICMAFNLNEDWLLNGNEPMLIKPDTFILDEFVKQRGATDLELQIVKLYFDLDADTRKMLVSHFRSGLAAAVNENPTMIIPDTPEELEAECPPLDFPSTSGKDAG